MLALAFIKAVITATTGNILASLNHIMSEKFNCIRQMKTLHGLRHWDIFIHPIKNAVFIKQQMVVRHGSKHYLLTIQRVLLTLISTQKIQTSYTPLCGTGAGVRGNLKKAALQVASLRATMGVKHGKKFRATVQGSWR